MNNNNELIDVLRCIINNTEHQGAVDWNNFFENSNKHKLISFAYEKSKYDLSCPEQMKRHLKQAVALQVFEDVTQTQEIDSVLSLFEKNHIPVIMMKGWVMKKLYPRSDMRSMSDTDIFMKSEDEKDVHKLLLSEGYNSLYSGNVENVYEKNPCIVIEMHKNLFSFEENWNNFFVNPSSPMYIWNRLTNVKGYSCIYQFDPELYYVYMIAHTAKHLIDGGGIGVRAFLDIYVYKKHFEKKLDNNIIRRDLKLLGIEKFADKAAALSECWFAETESDIIYPDSSYEDFANYIINGGVYGNMENFVVNNEAMKDNANKVSKCRYILKRAFPSRNSMEKRYPNLKGYPILLPYYWMKRWCIDGLERKKIIKKEIMNLKNIDSDKVEKIKVLYKDWGLL